jgi:hypothetical protein
MNNSTTGVGETHTNLAIRQTVAAGVAAGTPIVPTGWVKGSSVKSVVTLAGVDRTADFTETLLSLFIAAHP